MPHEKKNFPGKKERHPIRLKIEVRKQTPEEERQYQAALRLFLTELVRQEFHAVGGRASC
jgi:hypothetical protein